MKILKTATVLTKFRCTTYPDMGTFPYKVCIGRQLAKTPGHDWLYPECAECIDGKDVLKRFEGYKPEKKKTPNWNTTGCHKNIVKKKKTRAYVDCLTCKHQLQTQIEAVIQLIGSGQDDPAVRKLEIILEGVCNLEGK